MNDPRDSALDELVDAAAPAAATAAMARQNDLTVGDSPTVYPGWA